jgi:opacity protein-like surface antigen
MYKKNLLIAILTLISLNVFSQKGYVAISAGPAIPNGHFASKDFYNESAGWAETGYLIDLSCSYKLGKNFGLSVLLRSRSNNMDNSAFESELTRVTGTSWTVESEPWILRGIMLGGYGSFPISEVVSFDTRALIGYLSANSVEIDASINGSGGSAWVNQSSVSATSFSYLLGAGFKFHLSKSVCLLAQADYQYAEPEFRGVDIRSSASGQISTNNIRQLMGTINIGFGLGILL